MLEKEYAFLEYLNELQNTKRYMEYDPIFSESVSEHSYKLIAMADKLFDLLELDLDYRKCIRLAMYHDLCEIGLKEDLDAYMVLNDDNLQILKKEQENQNILEISKTYEFKDIYDIFIEYEKQVTLESKFINALDKIEPKLRCLKVQNVKLRHPDFIATHADDSVRNFPKLLPFYKVVKEKMRERFEQSGFKWKKEYDYIFEENSMN